MKDGKKTEKKTKNAKYEYAKYHYAKYDHKYECDYDYAHAYNYAKYAWHKTVWFCAHY